MAWFSGDKWQGSNAEIDSVITAQNFLKAKQNYEKRYRQHTKMAERSRRIAQAHNSDFDGYRSFLCDPAYAGDSVAFPSSLPETDRTFFISAPKFLFREIDRQRHTYITAETGHGKSVTIETLMYHYINRNYFHTPREQPCLILIDPHGDLAKSVARFKSPPWLKDWLAYIKPAESTKLTPTINPFDIKSKNWNDIALATDAFIEVFREVMKGDKDGISFSPQMVTILKPCIATLLHMDKTSVADLILFLSDEKAEYEPYLNHARQHLTNPSQRDFLKRDFFRDSYNPSKLSIKTKIRNLLADDYFYNFLCGETTFDIEEAIYRRSVILFDLSNLTDAAGSAIGRFIMATVTKFAFAQGEQPYPNRIPIHLFIDECQDFISDSMKQIVTKTRKFRLYGTFAQQFCGQGMDTELRRAIIGNSRIKISGGNEITSLKTIAAETGAPIEELQALETGHFHVKAGKAPSVAVKIPRIPNTCRLTDAEWKERKREQIKRHYRPIDHLNSPLTGAFEGPEPDSTPAPVETTAGKPAGVRKRRRRRKPAHSTEN